MKYGKKVLALLTAAVMTMGMALPALAADVTVAVSTRVLNDKYLVEPVKVTIPDNGTVLDAIKDVKVSGSEKTTETAGTHNGNPVTLYETGIFNYRSSEYGPYLYAVDVPGHSSVNRYFDDDGTASDWSNASGEDYTYARAIADLEAKYNLGNTWNNIVHVDNELTELDYNNNSGWMVLTKDADGKYTTNNNGLSTVLKDGDEVLVSFTMFMGLDLGQNSYINNGSAWVPESAFPGSFAE